MSCFPQIKGDKMIKFDGTRCPASRACQPRDLKAKCQGKVSRQNWQLLRTTPKERERKLMKKIVEVLANREELIDRSLGIVLSKIHAAIAERGVCTIAAAGGSTPEPLYRALSTQDLPWDKIHVFWGDERYVPPEHPDSNQKMARLAWLDRVNIPARNIHPMPTGAGDPAADASAHQIELQQFFKVSDGEFPAFDIILLGIGDDAHTASDRGRRPHSLSISRHSSPASSRRPSNCRQQRRSTPHHLYSPFNQPRPVRHLHGRRSQQTTRPGSNFCPRSRRNDLSSQTRSTRRRTLVAARCGCWLLRKIADRSASVPTKSALSQTQSGPSPRRSRRQSGPSPRRSRRQLSS